MDQNEQLPYISKDLEGISGKIREIPDNFIVEEVPVYSPSGEGEHVYINITKKLLTTKDVEKTLSNLFQFSQEKIGTAGLKDKNAITTQTFSLLFDGINKDKEEKEKKLDEIKKKIEETGLKVNWISSHTNKLKPGHLLGNNFSIIITNVQENAFEKALKIAELLKKTGVPNYYGEQRFGIKGENTEKALKIINRELRIRDKWLRKFLISSLQSYLCNLYLAERVNLGFNKLLKGDIAKKYDTGGLFVVEDITKEQERYNKKEIGFTAPMYGKDLWKAENESGKLEEDILLKTEISIDKLENYCSGTRRLGRLLLDNLKVEKVENGIKLNFFLPKGAFATIVLREFMKS